MNSFKTQVITKKDALQIYKTMGKGYDAKANALMPLIVRMAKANGQDTLSITEAAKLANKMPAEAEVRDYRYYGVYEYASTHREDRAGPTMLFPEYVGPRPLKATGLIAGWAGVAAVVLPVLKLVGEYVRDIANYSVYSIQNGLEVGAIIAAGLTGVAAATHGLIRIWSKDRQENLQKFAYNIEQALSNAISGALANQKDIENKVSAIKESVEKA